MLSLRLLSPTCVLAKHSLLDSLKGPNFLIPLFNQEILGSLVSKEDGYVLCILVVLKTLIHVVVRHFLQFTSMRRLATYQSIVKVLRKTLS